MRRVLALLALVAIATAVAAAPAQARVRHYVLGRSEQGRPIRAIERGDPAAPKRLLVFGLIHGNEPAGRAVARKLAAGAPPPGPAVRVVRDLDPDRPAGRRSRAPPPAGRTTRCREARRSWSSCRRARSRRRRWPAT